jgi:hypothetical protein
MSKSVKQTKQPKIKKAKQRSPNYPVLGLEKAIELTAKLQEANGLHESPIKLVHKLWDFSEGSAGAANQCVAALKSYGLITISGNGDNRKIAISPTGDRIVRKAPDRSELIRKAATAPTMHAEILDHFGAKGLPNDTLLKDYLVWERPEGQRFNEKSVDGFIQRFRDTLQFSGVDLSGKIEPAGSSENAEESETEIPMTESPAVDHPPTEDGIKKPPLKPAVSEKPLPPGMAKMNTQLDEGPVTISWPDELSKDSYEEFIYWLEGVKRRAARKAGIEPDEPKKK